jgi:hypothetical protein
MWGAGKVVGGADERKVTEVGGVGQLMEFVEELVPAGAETEVADVGAARDRPAESGDEGRAATGEVRTEDLDAEEGAVGGE